jgi:hypothetical protein
MMRKLALWQIITGVAAAALSILLIEHKISGLMAEDFLQRAHASGHALAARLNTRGGAGDAASLHAAIEHGIAAAEADWAYLTDAEGKIAAHTVAGNVPEALQQSSLELEPGFHTIAIAGGSAAYYVIREPLEGGRRGALYMGFGALHLQAAERRARAVAVIAAAVVLLLGVGALALGSGGSAAPDAALAVREPFVAGDDPALWHSSPTHSMEAAGRLAEAMNRLADGAPERPVECDVKGRWGQEAGEKARASAKSDAALLDDGQAHGL